MTPNQKETIIRMRQSGTGYAAIAEKLGISKNTVKTFCRRNDLAGVGGKPADEKPCLQCGKPVPQIPGRKPKKFCCDLCRSRYWDSHIGETKRSSAYEHVCPVCGGTYYAYSSRKRKYCSVDCYISGRFGGAVCE